MTEPAHTHEFTDEELAGQLQAGSLDAFNDLVNRYSGRLLRYLRYKAPSLADAEDLVQETFLKAYHNIDRYQADHKFSTWLFTIATRLAIDHHRRRQVRQTRPMEQEAAPNPLERVARQDDAHQLWIVARQLRPNQYQALWLRYTEEMTTGEIAQVMNKTALQVRVLLHRARTKLAVLLQREQEVASAASLDRLSYS